MSHYRRKQCRYRARRARRAFTGYTSEGRTRQRRQQDRLARLETRELIDAAAAEEPFSCERTASAGGESDGRLSSGELAA